MILIDPLADLAAVAAMRERLQRTLNEVGAESDAAEIEFDGDAQPRHLALQLLASLLRSRATLRRGFVLGPRACDWAGRMCWQEAAR